jgi:hypothetical protein
MNTGPNWRSHRAYPKLTPYAVRVATEPYNVGARRVEAPCPQSIRSFHPPQSPSRVASGERVTQYLMVVVFCSCRGEQSRALRHVTHVQKGKELWLPCIGIGSNAPSVPGTLTASKTGTVPTWLRVRFCSYNEEECVRNTYTTDVQYRGGFRGEAASFQPCQEKMGLWQKGPVMSPQREPIHCLP